MKKTFRGVLAWIGGHGYVAIAVALLIVVGTWGFIEIADEVVEGETQQFDDWAIRVTHDPTTGDPVGPRWLQEIGRDLTALGGMAVITLVIAAVVGYLLIVRKYHAIFLVVVATVGGFLISAGLKYLFARGRPELVPHASHVYSYSFPSGHSMLSAVVYLTLGVMLARLVPNRSAKIYFMGLAIFLSFLIGVSRVYMGVHYPTDVLAGWTAGLVWATLCYIVARQLQIRGKVERDVDEPGGVQAARATQGQG